MAESQGRVSVWGRSGARVLAGTVALAAVYFAAGRLGLLIPIAEDHVTLLWAPTGIALAAVLRFGYAALPGIVLGAFLVNLAVGGPPGLVLSIAAGNALEALAGAWLLRRAGFRPSLERVRDVLLFIVFGVLAAPMVSATAGAASLAAFGRVPPGQDLSGLGSFWWLGDAMGALLVTPLLLTWTELPRSWRPRGRRVLEALLLGAGLLVASGLTLSAWVDDPILHPPLAFTLFPFLVWAALRFGPRGAATSTLLAAAVAVWATMQGFSPFAGGTLDERILYLHTYMAMAAVTSMLLAAVLTERHEAEEERSRLLTREREARAEAEAANEAKDRFLATLSHELRTPLTPVLAVVSGLAHERVPPGLVRPLDVIRRNVELEARLIDDLLDLTRIERGKLELRPEVTDAHKVAEHTLEICCEQEVQAGRLRVVEDLAAEDHRIWADPSRLTQVMWNLLSNAVKFTPAGGTVTVRTWNEADRLLLQVVDTGVGIDPEVLPHVFDAFEQGRARSPRGAGGLGLGLAISKAIVEMHGGQLTAASEGRGRGATFTVSLPATLPQETGEIPTLDDSGIRAPKSKIENLHILLVEDHADTAEAMADLLSLMGHRVTAAGTVAQALETARRERFDLVLSDLGLPDGSGLDVMCEISRGDGIPGIALSGYGMEDDVRRSHEAGFSKHLTKPVSLPALEAAIRHVFRGKAPTAGRAERERPAGEQKQAKTEEERQLAHIQELARAAQEARAEAEEANRMKDQFLATLSHELRTPLNAILGWAQILRAGRLDPEGMARGLDAIERNSRAQAQLIGDLLDISRITSGKLRLEVQPVDLAEIVEAALSTVLPAAEAREVSIERFLDPRVGPVSGDPDRLQQVIWNLLSNAVKFTPKGGRVEVHLTVVENGGHAEIRVRDTGQGIAPELLPHVFDLFRQDDGSTTWRQGGLGLGLPIVRELVELQGGTVWAESAGPGQGATFTVVLPLVAARPQGETPPEPFVPAREEEPSPPLAGLRLLAVDDEPDTLEVMAELLSMRGAEVATASSAAQALEMIGQFEPDVLVSDISMPGRDGYDLIREIRTGRGPDDLPAVAVTAFAGPEDRKRAISAGFQVHMAKPVDPGELVSVIARLAPRPPLG